MVTNNNEKMQELTVEEKLQNLYELQRIDTEIDKIKTLRGELPLEVQDLEDEIAGLETRIENLKVELGELDKTSSTRKMDIKKAEEAIKKYSEQLDNVRNNREYDALSKEIEFQKLEIELQEKRIREAQKAKAEKEARRAANRAERAAKEAQPSTYDQTLALFRRGMTCDQIATERNLKPSTINVHFTKLIRKGLISVEEVISPVEYAAICDTLDRLGPEATTDTIMAALPGVALNDIYLVKHTRD